MKKILSILLATALSLTLFAACQSGGYEYVSEKGTLIIGLDDEFAPMGFRDQNNELVGFDVDLARAVCAVMGIEPVFQPIDWNSKEMELKSKRIDCIWNGMSATLGRQKTMALTKRYLNNRIVIMTLDSTITVDSVDDLASLNIATQADSSALEVMQAHEGYASFKDNITEYRSYDDAIMDLQTGRADCIVVDEVLGEYKNSKFEDDKKMHVCEFNFGDDLYAIGCRKGETDLADTISDAIQKCIDSGTAAEISEKWFGRNIVIFED